MILFLSLIFALVFGSLFFWIGAQADFEFPTRYFGNAVRTIIAWTSLGLLGYALIGAFVFAGIHLIGKK